MPETFKTVTWEAEHVPERHDPAPHDKDQPLIDLPGVVNIYAVIDGGRILMDQVKAPRVFEAIERAKRTDDTAAPKPNPKQR